jgi:hypothetical protein
MLVIPGSLITATNSLAAADDRYRVELLVFRHTEQPATPDQTTRLRRFHQAFSLQETPQPPAPVALDKQDGSFANIWSRLDRLAEYEPLLRTTFEQTFYDYHPPVRIHDDEVMARELHLPAETVLLDLTVYEDSNPDAATVDLFAAFEQPLYRLDGTIQLRRSRFLHIDLDLEYRLDGPAWEREFPTLSRDLLEPGFTWVGDSPKAVPNAPESTPAPVVRPSGESGAFIAVPEVNQPDATGKTLPEPFMLYRLEQSRQIRSNTLQYFDSAFLGAIVRVTPIAAEAP